MPRDLSRAGSSLQLLFWRFWFLLLAQPAASLKPAKPKGENEPIMLEKCLPYLAMFNDSIFSPAPTTKVNSRPSGALRLQTQATPTMHQQP